MPATATERTGVISSSNLEPAGSALPVTAEIGSTERPDYTEKLAKLFLGTFEPTSENSMRNKRRELAVITDSEVSAQVERPTVETSSLRNGHLTEELDVRGITVGAASQKRADHVSGKVIGPPSEIAKLTLEASMLGRGENPISTSEITRDKPTTEPKVGQKADPNGMQNSLMEGITRATGQTNTNPNALTNENVLSQAVAKELANGNQNPNPLGVPQSILQGIRDAAAVATPGELDKGTKIQAPTAEAIRSAMKNGVSSETNQQPELSFTEKFQAALAKQQEEREMENLRALERRAQMRVTSSKPSVDTEEEKTNVRPKRDAAAEETLAAEISRALRGETEERMAMKKPA